MRNALALSLALAAAPLESCSKDATPEAPLTNPHHGDLDVDAEMQKARAKALEFATQDTVTPHPVYKPWAKDTHTIVTDNTKYAHQCFPEDTTQEGALPDANAVATAARKTEWTQARALAEEVVTSSAGKNRWTAYVAGDPAHVKDIDQDLFTRITELDPGDALCPPGDYYVLSNGRVPVTAFQVDASHTAYTDAFWSGNLTTADRAAMLVHQELCADSGDCAVTTATPVYGIAGNVTTNLAQSLTKELASSAPLGTP